MGNVNGREDGSSSLSGLEEEGGNSVHEAIAAPMGHSPPHSPAATQSPLMFTPQVRYFYFSRTCEYFFLTFVGWFSGISISWNVDLILLHGSRRFSDSLICCI